MRIRNQQDGIRSPARQITSFLIFSHGIRASGELLFAQNKVQLFFHILQKDD